MSILKLRYGDLRDLSKDTGNHANCWKKYSSDCNVSIFETRKTSFKKHNSDRKSELNDGNRRVSKRIVAKRHKTTASRITSAINTHLQEAVSPKTIRCELHMENTHGRAAILQPFITSCNAVKRRI